jgi:hypothetical protein
MTSDRTTREAAMADQCDVIVVGGGPATRALLTREEPFTGNMACGFLGLQYTPPDRRVIAPDAARRRLRPVVAPEPPDPPTTRIDNPILKETNQ